MRAISYFPYEPRPYQEEVIRSLYGKLSRGNVCLHAPTGFGKTPVILAALMPYVERGYRVIWAVRTGNETDRPIEELKVMVEKNGLDVFGLSYRGKRDMCPLARKYGDLDHSEVSYLCSQSKKKCPYYNNYRRFFDPTPFVDRGPLTYAEVYEVALTEQVCPYWAQRGLLMYADVVSMNYNYIVNPYLEWSIRSLVDFRKTILVVDEAHNLQRIELGSSEITLGTIRRALNECGAYNAPPEVLDLVVRLEDRALKTLAQLEDGEDTEFLLSDFLSEKDFPILDKAKKIGERIRRKRLSEGKRPRSSLYRLSTFWLYAAQVEGTKGIALVAEREGDNLRINVWDMRSAEVLAGRWSLFKRCVFMSGTLEPIDAFAETIGLRKYSSLSVPPIYKKENVKVYITEGLNTRGEELDPSMAKLYVGAIVSFLRAVRTSAAVFTASYRVQNELIKAGLIGEAEKAGYKVHVERRGMRGQEARAMLDSFKSSRGRGLLLAPMGGRFAEGADFPGEELQAIFLVGIPFDKPTVKVKLYLEYYEELYGAEKGRFYGYVVPALRRAAQALGRALRSPDDKAVLVLGDERYERYLHLLPDYVRLWARKVKAEDVGAIVPPW